ncbi:TIGR02281 family clan AA aspartic protease [Ramlibacter sp. H39-3-26]|uniref:retropepsin-like aspartic protease family protein n=1 Tax=Curvibacter soli TaxID=3031331 RepID=UPI0023DA334E|nr:TIGR02281 family clan AA aspartic protease [Ramlibacter sp. H39-3-26]MDF1485262.1 TIGR02281 family clan AA aspartic protease [Ramlibacter sp. H39-3-26]
MPHAPHHLLALASPLLLLACGSAWGQSVGLAGILGRERALLVVDGGAPRSVAAGQSLQGVKVLEIGRDAVVVDIAGSRATLRMGDAPVSVGNRGGGNRIVLMADSRGHFIHQGRINGQTMQFMVDTGATTVAIGMAEAERMGLDFRAGTPVRLATANGTAQGWAVKLGSLRIDDVELFGVDAVVTPMPMPYVLLGNNFLAQFQLTRQSDQMVLEKRY